MLTDLSDARDLPYASTLCGNCREVCPVRIDIPRMLLHLRKELTVGETYPEARSAPLSERLAMKLWRVAVGSPMAMRAANVLGRLAMAPLRRGGRVPRIPGPLSAWTQYRDFPALAARPFRSRWRKRR
jgi:L-lactate dehydrogenase complex protein LldF